MAIEFLKEGARFLPAPAGFRYEIRSNWIGRELPFDGQLRKSLIAAYATQDKADPSTTHCFYVDAQSRARQLYEEAPTERLTQRDRKSRALYGYTSIVVSYEIGELQYSRDFAEGFIADPLVPEELRIQVRAMLDKTSQAA